MFFFLEVLGFICLVVAVVRLSGRVAKLEQQIKMPVPVPQPQVQASAMPAQSTMPASGAPVQAPAAVVGPTEPTLGDRLGAWLKEDWLLKLGALMLLLGFSWLATYAFMHNWIGPVGRISLGVVAGTCLLIFGFIRMKKYIHQGGVFLVLGSAVVILTLFAARTFYDFLTPFSALSIMFLASAFVALASVRYRVQSLAIVSLVLAAITPMMINSGSQNYFALFTYLFIITIGSVWVVALTGWRNLLVVALIMISVYSGPQWIEGPQAGVLMLVYGFAALFFVAGTLGIIKAKAKESAADLVIAAGNGIFLLIWIIAAVPQQWQSLVIAAWMLVFAVGGFIVFRITQRPAPFLLYASVAVAMLAAATAVELNGAALTLAYIVEATLIPLVIYALLRDLKLTEKASFLLIAPAIFSLPSFGAYEWQTHVLHQHFVVLLSMAVALLLVGLFIWRRRSESPTPLTMYPGFIVAGLVYIYVLIWLSVHAATPISYVATIVSLVLYTLIGLSTYFYGKLNNAKMIQAHGGVLMGFVVGRLLIIDIWAMQMGGRIVMFFVVGALLTTTAFVGRKKKAPVVV